MTETHYAHAKYSTSTLAPSVWALTVYTLLKQYTGKCKYIVHSKFTSSWIYSEHLTCGNSVHLTYTVPRVVHLQDLLQYTVHRRLNMLCKLCVQSVLVTAPTFHTACELYPCESTYSVQCTSTVPLWVPSQVYYTCTMPMQVGLAFTIHMHIIAVLAFYVFTARAKCSERGQRLFEFFYTVNCTCTVHCTTHVPFVLCSRCTWECTNIANCTLTLQL